ncbi:hypothetical protein [Phytopseudomonas dryadis]|uniref:DUF3077 domain-containing protein n=1 Tax=Phytopseudomonas dryadis TaxID=2487520 RepID=A0A4Q9QUC5_9GAMM|nr:hypothetical protein [Pseudomonas dryadis]TBU86779.1 hypothetical protein DNK44_22000 [Pseudomonas dryadis]
MSIEKRRISGAGTSLPEKAATEQKHAGRQALELKAAARDLAPISAPICSQVEFRPAEGTEVKDLLEGSSDILAGCTHFARILVDGNKEDAEATGYCLGFLLDSAKSLLDTAHSRLQRGEEGE